MRTLKRGDTGPQVQLLQLALRRQGSFEGSLSGNFGPATQQALKNFQRRMGLSADGIAGERTHKALEPYYTGFVRHRIRTGDTLYGLSMLYGSSIQAITTANPQLDALQLRPGISVIVPLNFPVVPTDLAWCSALIDFCCRGLAARYPFITPGDIGRSVMGKPLLELRLGRGDNRVFYNAAHHANEWITTPLLLRFCEQLCSATAKNGKVYGYSARELLEKSTLSMVPAVDPDGIDLATGELTSGRYYDRAREIAQSYPQIPFPTGWKANIDGVDLNLQYPAEWERARQIKFEQGFTGPAPRDFVGDAPLVAPEAMAVYRHTLLFDPELILAYHTQGSTIFWKYLDYEPPYSRAIAHAFGEVSGYLVEETPYGSGFAGYKDWFIQNYNRPGYTIEAGLGENPLPISQFAQIYEDNLGIMALGLVPADEIALEA